MVFTGLGKSNVSPLNSISNARIDRNTFYIANKSI